VIYDLEFADVGRADAEGADFFEIFVAGRLRGTEAKKTKGMRLERGRWGIFFGEDGDDGGGVGVADVIFFAVGEEMIWCSVDRFDGEFVAEQVGAVGLFGDAERQELAGFEGGDRFTFESFVVPMRMAKRPRKVT